MASLKEQSQQNTENYEKFLNLGIQFESERKYELAIKNFTVAIKLNPNNADSYIRRAKAYNALPGFHNTKRRLFSKAIADYTKAIELNPNDAHAYMRRADIYFSRYAKEIYYKKNGKMCKSEHFDKILQDYTKAIELNPNDYWGYYNRARLYHKPSYNHGSWLFCKEQALIALNDYTKIIELLPEKDDSDDISTDCYYTRAECYQFLKEYNKAIDDYSKFLELYNFDDNYRGDYSAEYDAGNIFLNRGKCYEELKEYKKAIADYSKFIELNTSTDFMDSYNVNYFQRARCYQELKEYEKAIADYEKIFLSSILSPSPKYYFYLGNSYKELGKYEPAFMNFDNGIKACKDSTEKEKYTKLAHDAAMSINDYNRAKNYLEQLTSLAEHKDVYLGNIDKAEQLEKLNQELKLEIQQKEAAHKALHEKEKEMLSFFTHTMRNALATAPESLRQAIRLLGSEDYESNQKHYKAINKIAALFSTLSLTDCLIDTFKQSISEPEEFQRAWQNDNEGEATPKWVIAAALRQSLNRIIFMSDTSELRQLLNNADTPAIVVLRKSFIDNILPLNLDNQGIAAFYQWLSSITTLEIAIENHDLHFGVNQVKFSLLFAISSELILNALKYWNGNGKIQIRWYTEQEQFIFKVTNPCETNASSSLAGTHKGIAFIKRLMELLGEKAQFNCAVEGQLFIAELKLHHSLLEHNA